MSMIQQVKEFLEQKPEGQALSEILQRCGCDRTSRIARLVSEALGLLGLGSDLSLKNLSVRSRLEDPARQMIVVEGVASHPPKAYPLPIHLVLNGGKDGHCQIRLRLSRLEISLQECNRLFRHYGSRPGTAVDFTWPFPEFVADFLLDADTSDPDGTDLTLIAVPKTKAGESAFPGLPAEVEFSVFRFYAKPYSGFAGLSVYTTFRCEGVILKLKVDIPLGQPSRCWQVSLVDPITVSEGLSAIVRLAVRLAGVVSAGWENSLKDLDDKIAKDLGSLQCVVLSDLQVHLFGGALEYLSFQVDLDTGGGWQIFDGMILKGAGFSGAIQRGGCFELGLYGQADFGGVSASVEADIPFSTTEDWRIRVTGYVGLPGTTSLGEIENSLPPLLKSGGNGEGLGPALPQDFRSAKGDANGIIIKKFETVFQPFVPRLTSVAFGVQVNYTFDFGYGITIRRLDVEAAWNKEKKLTGLLGVLFVLGGEHRLELQAELRPNSEYIFTNKWSGRPVKIGEMCGLPSFLADLQVTGATLRYAKAAERQTFDVKLAALYEQTKADLNFTLTKRGAEIEYTGSLTLAKNPPSQPALSAFVGDAKVFPELSSVRLEALKFVRKQDEVLVTTKVKAWGSDCDAGFLRMQGTDQSGRLLVGLSIKGPAKEGVTLIWSRQIPLLGSMIANEPLLVLEELAVFAAKTGARAKDLKALAGILSIPLSFADDEDPLKNLVLRVKPKSAPALLFGAPEAQAPQAASPKKENETEAVRTQGGQGSPAKPSSKSSLMTVGPLTLHRLIIGPAGQGSLMVALDATLTVKAVTLDLYGLGVITPFTELKPSLTLSGAGLRFETPTVTLGASFVVLKEEDAEKKWQCLIKGKDGGTFKVVRAFEASAILKTPTFSLSGSGAFITVQNEKEPAKTANRLLLTISANGIIGGPPAFFVTGFLGAFSLNTRLRQPTIEDLDKFPLLASDLNVSNFADWLSPADGDSWVALGIYFTSFELVTCRAVLFAQIGADLEFALFGSAELTLPKMPKGGGGSSGKIFARIGLKLAASIKPSEGLLSVIAVVDSGSFLLDEACRLTGGVAYCLWMAGPHAGDFVMTVGGYHPDFVAPLHYPRVPRVGFDWKYNDKIQLKGELYYALTPSRMMFGGALEIQYRDGSLHAWMIARVNTFVEWAPFFFKAKVELKAGISYTFQVLGFARTLNLEISAVLELQGMPLGGRARVEAGPISFEVGFGSLGVLEKPAAQWSDVRNLLPAQPLKIVLLEGLANSGALKNAAKKPSDPIPIRPSQLAFHVETALPVNKIVPPAGLSVDLQEGEIVVQPTKGTITDSVLTITIKKQDGQIQSVGATWPLRASLRRQNLPASLWRRPKQKESVTLDSFCVGVTCAPPGSKAKRALSPKSSSEPTAPEDNSKETYQWRRNTGPSPAPQIQVEMPGESKFEKGPLLAGDLLAAMGVAAPGVLDHPAPPAVAKRPKRVILTTSQLH